MNFTTRQSSGSLIESCDSYEFTVGDENSLLSDYNSAVMQYNTALSNEDPLEAAENKIALAKYRMLELERLMNEEEAA